MSGQLIGRTGLFQALGALMLKIEHRRMQRSNGLIDDFVVSGEPVDYVTFATTVEAAIKSGAAETLRTESRIQIEVLSDSQQPELFTSLQNTEDCYPSLEDWERRSVLRIRGSTAVLKELYQFLMDVSGRGDGYSYLSEYSSRCAYSSSSPEWRLHL